MSGKAISVHSTPYPDVDTVLHYFRLGAQTALGHGFRGMYLTGSLALGDFDPRSSDIDFIVVTDGDVTADELAALRALHARFNAGESLWATDVEAVYIAAAALRRHDPARSLHPHIERGAGETLRMDQLDSGWVVQRHILRQCGIAVAGPSPHTLIDPVDPRELHQAVALLMREWWGPMVDDLWPLKRPGYQAYAVLTMCRMLYTLQHGAIVSKPAAARWAQGYWATNGRTSSTGPWRGARIAPTRLVMTRATRDASSSTPPRGSDYGVTKTRIAGGATRSEG